MKNIYVISAPVCHRRWISPWSGKDAPWLFIGTASRWLKLTSMWHRACHYTGSQPGSRRPPSISWSSVTPRFFRQGAHTRILPPLARNLSISSFLNRTTVHHSRFPRHHTWHRMSLVQLMKFCMPALGRPIEFAGYRRQITELQEAVT